MLKSLELIFQRLLEEVSLEHHRFLYKDFDLKDRLTGIVGPRGVGKTTMMLQLIKERFPNQPKTFYFSADHIYFEKTTIYEFVEALYLTEGTHTFFIDEIHKYKSWSQELKNLYDGFPSINIVFSGSSSLDLVKGSHDLSRRARMYQLPGLSFREYLNIKTGQSFEAVPFEQLMNNHRQLDSLFSTLPGIKGHFRDYTQKGFYPFFQENLISYHQKLLEVIDKTIYEDIANFYNLKTVNLHHFKKILNFLASIPPGKTNVHNLAKNLSIDDKTVSHYLTHLQETGLIQMIYPGETGNVGLRRPDKIFLNNTNLQYAIEGNLNTPTDIGSIRELFFIQAIRHSGKKIFHSKHGDYKVDQYTFEIGGSNKTTKQIRNIKDAFLIKDDTLTASAREIPLMAMGFLY